MKKIIKIFTVIVIIGFGWSLPCHATDLSARATATTTQNFLHTLIPKIITGSTGAMIETIQYFDGLGKPCQTVVWQLRIDS